MLLTFSVSERRRRSRRPSTSAFWSPCTIEASGDHGRDVGEIEVTDEMVIITTRGGVATRFARDDLQVSVAPTFGIFDPGRVFVQSSGGTGLTVICRRRKQLESVLAIATR
jgi:hypothetical protein